MRQFRLSPMPRAGREKGFVQRNVKRTCHVAFWGVRMRKPRIIGAFGSRSAPHTARGNTFNYNPRSMAANEGARARAPVSAIAEAPVEMFMALTLALILAAMLLSSISRTPSPSTSQASPCPMFHKPVAALTAKPMESATNGYSTMTRSNSGASRTSNARASVAMPPTTPTLDLLERSS